MNKKLIKQVRSLERFKNGDLVTWELDPPIKPSNPERDKKFTQELMKKYGKGPFEIRIIRDCYEMELESTLHPQFVTIFKNGKPFMKDNGYGKMVPRQFTGSYFKKVR